MPTSWTHQTKNTASWSYPSKKGDAGIEVGMPLGLLLCLTYATIPVVSWTHNTKNTTSWTNQTKN